MLHPVSSSWIFKIEDRLHKVEVAQPQETDSLNSCSASSLAMMFRKKTKSTVQRSRRLKARNQVILRQVQGAQLVYESKQVHVDLQAMLTPVGSLTQDVPGSMVSARQSLWARFVALLPCEAAVLFAKRAAVCSNPTCFACHATLFDLCSHPCTWAMLRVIHTFDVCQFAI